MRPHALAAFLLACTAEPSGVIDDYGATGAPIPEPSTPEPSEEESVEPRPDVGADPEPTDEPTPEPTPIPTEDPGPTPVTPDPGCDDMTYSLFGACSGLQYQENPPPLDVGDCPVLVDDPCSYQNCYAGAWVDHHQQQVRNLEVCTDRYPACESVSGLDRQVCMKGCYTAQVACARARVAECVTCPEVAAACTAGC